MDRLVKGDVAVVPFPFADLTGAKRRPALVLARAGGSDVLLCQITSRDVRDDAAVPLRLDAFVQGGLRVPSNVRPNRLFTADERLVLYTAGRVHEDVVHVAAERVKAMLDGA